MKFIEAIDAINHGHKVRSLASKHIYHFRDGDVCYIDFATGVASFSSIEIASKWEIYSDPVDKLTDELRGIYEEFHSFRRQAEWILTAYTRK